MKIDLYTKTVLTFIAFSLTFIALQNFIPRADAKIKATQAVGICAVNSEKCVAHYDSNKEGVSYLGVLDAYAFEQLKGINQQLKLIEQNTSEINNLIQKR